MKKLYATLFIIFCFGFCRAQYVTVSDTAFVSWLDNNGFDSCMNGNQLDTTCPALLKTTALKFTYTYISDLTDIQYFKNLDSLNIGFNYNLWNLPAFPSTLTYLICDSSNVVDNIPVLPPNLHYLNCSHTPYLFIFPALPSSLYYLDCSYDGPYSLPALPYNLTYLNCSNGSQLSFTSLPTLPNNLTYLDCSYNVYLITLPSLPPTLTYLDCSITAISNIPALPFNLKYLDCSEDDLDSLPVLPSSLTYLDCHWDDLAILPDLYSGLNFLDCSGNKFSNLPVLPSSLSYLDCSENDIPSLPALPSNLTYLDCSENDLSYLPALPSPLSYLDCSDNKLSSLPLLPDSLYELNLSDNPVHCLPEIKKIKYLNFQNTIINCVPDYGQVDTSSPNIDSLPLCDSLHPNPCTISTGINKLPVASSGLEVFPNPTHDIVNIVLNKTYNNCVITVTDVTGRTAPLNLPKGETSGWERMFAVDLSGLAAGIYFVRISTAGETQTVKVVKE